MTRRKASARLITQEELREVLNYDQETGVFTARVASPNRKKGAIAGSTGNRYQQISVLGRMYRAHRLVWLYVYGAFPEHEIDHINRDKKDNRLVNLRAADRTLNAQNHGRRAPPSGYAGVKRKSGSALRWEATIGLGGGTKYLGSFDTPQKAHEAYLSARRSLHVGYVQETQ